MCGIVGVMGKETYQRSMWSLFNLLIQVDVIRGCHGTGVVSVLDDMNIRTVKGSFLPQELFSTQKYQSLVKNKRDPVCLIGHNRAATLGSHTDKNAHPFTYGRVSMVHNGTVNNKTMLMKDAGVEGQFDTDSETIAFLLNSEGIDWVWPKLLGAAALVWWDNKTKTLNAVTDGQRPLFFAHAENTSRLIWASEKWMIESMAEREKLKLDAFEGTHTTWKPNPHYLFTFKYHQGSVWAENRKLEERMYTYTYTHKPATPHVKKGGGPTTPWVDKTQDRHPPGGNVVPINQTREQLTSETQRVNYPANAKKFMTEETFVRNFPFCFMCTEYLGDEYEHACVMDFAEGGDGLAGREDAAICSDCAQAAEKEEVSVSNWR